MPKQQTAVANQKKKKMASLSTKTFNSLNEASGINVVAVKAPNAIEAINKLEPLLYEGGVSYDKAEIMSEIMDVYDPYKSDVDGNQVFGYSNWKQLNYIFCANTSAFLGVLSSEVIHDGMTQVSVMNADYFVGQGAKQL